MAEAVSLVIRYSSTESVLRSTDDLPGMLLIAAMPPEHPPGFAIDGRVEPGAGGGRGIRERMDADLSGADWVEVEDVVAALADEEAATVLWKAMISTMTNAVQRSLASFAFEEFASYYELALKLATALGEAGYGPTTGRGD